MARTTLPVVTSAAAGVTIIAPVAVDQANGNQFTNTGREMLEITNGSGSTMTATITTNGVYTVGTVQYSVADLVVSIAAGAQKVCGPFDKVLFNDGTNQVLVDWSAGTSVTARVIGLGTQ